jgi:hypothetical protein
MSFALKNHEPVWIGIRKRPQQNSVHDTENGRVRANAKRERDDGDNRECRAFR